MIDPGEMQLAKVKLEGWNQLKENIIQLFGKDLQEEKNRKREVKAQRKEEIKG